MALPSLSQRSRAVRHSSQFQTNDSTVVCSGSEAGSYLRLMDSCITQLKAQGPSRTCNESKEEGEEGMFSRPCAQVSVNRRVRIRRHQGRISQPSRMSGIRQHGGFDARPEARPIGEVREGGGTRGYPCKQIHESIIGLLPRKYAKSQQLVA